MPGDALLDVRDVEDGVGVDEDAQHGGRAFGGDDHDAAQQQGDDGFLGCVPPGGVGAYGFAVPCVGVEGDDGCEDGAGQPHEGDGIYFAAADVAVDAAGQGEGKGCDDGCCGSEFVDGVSVFGAVIQDDDRCQYA